MKHILSAAAVLGLVAGAIGAGPANAGIVHYSGTDSGAPSSGPFPNSSAAQATFESHLASFNTITFEGLPTGDPHSVNPAPGVNITWTDCCGYPYGGIIAGNPFGLNVYGFNVTSGGNQWLGFAGGSATFTFTSAISAFGFWATGLQTVFTLPGDLTVKFNDGAAETLLPPVTAIGGAEYFSFTDAGKSITSITISDPSNDAWGIDDVTYGTAKGVVGVPEPGSLLLIGSGLVALGTFRRRKQRKA